MRDSWLTLVDKVLRPARPNLERCLEERAQYVAARRRLAEERARAMANCEAHIETARAAIFATGDGVVTSRMNDLEREWRRLSRSDPDGGLMDLWVRVAPASWVDRKRWRDSDPGAELDVAIALAADVEGVEAAERATASLRVALAAWGIPVGRAIRWRPFERDSDPTSEWLVEPLRAARVALSLCHEETGVIEYAGRLERDVQDAACDRFPDRPLLSGSLARAAFADSVLGAAAIAGRPNPVTALVEIWSAGYTLSRLDATGAVLEVPSLLA